MKHAARFLILPLLLISFASQALANISLTAAPPADRQFYFVINPGKTDSGAVEVENIGSTDLNVELYAADGTQSNQGTFALTTKSTEQQFIGKWVYFNDPVIHIKAGERKKIPFSIKVPDLVAPGTYSGGIAGQVSSGKNEGTKGNGVNVTSRVVVKMFIAIPGERVTKFDWNDFSYIPGTDTTKPYFKIGYANQGNTVINVDQQIDIEGFPGIKQTIDPTVANLTQGSKVEIPIKWDAPPYFGILTAKATATYSELNVLNSQNINEQTLEKSISIVIISPTVYIIAGLTLLAIIVLVVYISTRKKRAKTMVKTSVEHKVKAGETIMDLAEKYGTAWKSLAKLNKLKAPYDLKVGSIVLIPKPQQRSKKK